MCLLMIACVAACGRMSPPRYPKDSEYPRAYYVKMGAEAPPPPVTVKNDTMDKPAITDTLKEQYEKI